MSFALKRVCHHRQHWQPLGMSVRLSSDICQSVVKDGVKRITMTAPKTRNALSLEMINRLQDEIKRDQVRRLSKIKKKIEIQKISIKISIKILKYSIKFIKFQKKNIYVFDGD
jgi:hypothetical protein